MTTLRAAVVAVVFAGVLGSLATAQTGEFPTASVTLTKTEVGKDKITASGTWGMGPKDKYGGITVFAAPVNGGLIYAASIAQAPGGMNWGPLDIAVPKGSYNVWAVFQCNGYFFGSSVSKGVVVVNGDDPTDKNNPTAWGTNQPVAGTQVITGAGTVSPIPGKTLLSMEMYTLPVGGGVFSKTTASVNTSASPYTWEAISPQLPANKQHHVFAISGFEWIGGSGSYAASVVERTP